MGRQAAVGDVTRERAPVRVGRAGDGRAVAAVGAGALLAVLAVVLLGGGPGGGVAGDVADRLVGVVTDWKLYVGVAVLLVAERVLPVGPGRRLLSGALAVDLVWFVASIFFVVALADGYTRFLDRLFDDHLSFLVLPVGERWPTWLLVLVTFLVADLLAWFHHYVRHKVPVLWRFHAVHHAQRDMNLFTDSRVHPVEHLIARTILFVPFFVLGGDYAAEIAVVGVLLTWHERGYHASIRTSLGPLRHVLVTPQSHRIHHSCEARDLDTNFGVTLTIWDRMFGTLRTDFDRYPGTGVDDPDFPEPADARPAGALAGFGRQLAYPFRRGRPVVEAPALPT